MDVVAGMLAAQHADGAFVLCSQVVAPWSIRVEDGAPLTVVTVTTGSAVVAVDGRDPLVLRPGDAAVLRGERSYTVADAVGTTPQARIGPGQVCTRPDGSPLSDFRALGVRTWGNAPAGVAPGTVLLTGTYERDGQVARRLLAGLPDALVVRAADGGPAMASVVGLLGAELARDDVAQNVVLDRLVDLLTVAVLRSWLGSGADVPAWYAGSNAPVVGAALQRIHHEPERPWTLVALAAEAGVSRATLARQFAAAVGEPPMGYLSRWRLDLAADLLTSTDLTVDAIASRVGFAGGFSLSAAFSRHHGRSPTAYRRASA
ncbi:AraC family transcriptional regulator [Solicola sp. PLA-1-18]|uniref:AraC family transcriptional regulator n=1 Tax=Solicola sp. PLA-1-18 TaxID=3380532 RepID=UPI003B79EF1C